MASLRKENAALRVEASALKEKSRILEEMNIWLEQENQLLRNDNERMKRILNNYSSNSSIPHPRGIKANLRTSIIAVSKPAERRKHQILHPLL